MDVKTDFSDHRIHGGVLRADRASPTAGRLLTANRWAVATAMSQAGFVFARTTIQPNPKQIPEWFWRYRTQYPQWDRTQEEQRDDKTTFGGPVGDRKVSYMTSVAFLMGVSLLFVVYPNGAQTLVPRTIPCAVPRFALDIMRAHSSPPARVTP